MITDLRSILDSLSSEELDRMYSTSLGVIGDKDCFISNENLEDFIKLTSLAVAIEEGVPYLNEFDDTIEPSKSDLNYAMGCLMDMAHKVFFYKKDVLKGSFNIFTRMTVQVKQSDAIVLENLVKMQVYKPSLN